MDDFYTSDGKTYIELHDAKDLISWVKEIDEILPYVQDNSSRKIYIQIRINNILNLLKK